jgi:hypothetical protein
MTLHEATYDKCGVWFANFLGQHVRPDIQPALLALVLLLPDTRNAAGLLDVIASQANQNRVARWLVMTRPDSFKIIHWSKPSRGEGPSSRVSFRGDRILFWTG